MPTRRAALKGAAAAALSLTAGRVLAQASGTITVLVGASSSMDFTARAIADHLQATLGRTVIAVSKLGAGQRLALGEVKRAAPDGRTLVFVTTGPLAIHPHVYRKLDYDPDADFTPIIGMSKFDVALAVDPALGINSLQELVAWVKQRGESIFASAPGNGSFSHFTGMAIARSADLKLKHVPYKDSASAIVDLAGGRIPFMLTGMSAMLPTHQAGKIKIIAVSGSERSPLIPDVPTVSEQGVNVARSTTTGLFGPAGMPPDMVKMYHDAVLPMLSHKPFVDQLTAMGVMMWHATPEQLRENIRTEREYFGRIAKESGFEPLA